MRTASGIRSARRLLHIGQIVAALVICVAGLGATAYAQNAQNSVNVNIDFAFVAAGKEMPAGAYEFEVEKMTVVMRSVKGSALAVVMPAFTRLGRHDADRDPELVFDKVGGKLLLSELWIPDKDGYLLLDTPVNHDHRVIGGSRPH